MSKESMAEMSDCDNADENMKKYYEIVTEVLDKHIGLLGFSCLCPCSDSSSEKEIKYYVSKYQENGNLDLELVREILRICKEAKNTVDGNFQFLGTISFAHIATLLAFLGCFLSVQEYNQFLIMNSIAIIGVIVLLFLLVMSRNASIQKERRRIIYHEIAVIFEQKRRGQFGSGRQ